MHPTCRRGRVLAHPRDAAVAGQGPILILESKAAQGAGSPVRRNSSTGEVPRRVVGPQDGRGSSSDDDVDLRNARPLELGESGSRTPASGGHRSGPTGVVKVRTDPSGLGAVTGSCRWMVGTSSVAWEFPRRQTGMRAGSARSLKVAVAHRPAGGARAWFPCRLPGCGGRRSAEVVDRGDHSWQGNGPPTRTRVPARGSVGDPSGSIPCRHGALAVWWTRPCATPTHGGL